MNQEKIGQQIIIYSDGLGAHADGEGSDFAWLRTDTGQKKITREDGLTNNQTEYRAILSAVEVLPKESHAEIRTDSENTCCQLNGQHRISNPTLEGLYDAIYDLIEQNRLTVRFVWIPRRENLAGKLI
jgi:ribonuclease HI